MEEQDIIGQNQMKKITLHIWLVQQVKNIMKNVRANYGAGRPVIQVPSLSVIPNIGKNLKED